MTPREWHMHAIRSLERAILNYGLANQAMYDARRALECAQEPLRAELISDIVYAPSELPGHLQNLLNVLNNDPILDEPMDIDSAGEGPTDGTE